MADAIIAKTLYDGNRIKNNVCMARVVCLTDFITEGGPYNVRHQLINEVTPRSRSKTIFSVLTFNCYRRSRLLASIASISCANKRSLFLKVSLFLRIFTHLFGIAVNHFLIFLCDAGGKTNNNR